MKGSSDSSSGHAKRKLLPKKLTLLLISLAIGIISLQPTKLFASCTCQVSSTDTTYVTVSADTACQKTCEDPSATEVVISGYEGYCSCNDWTDCTSVCTDAGYYPVPGEQYCFMYIPDGNC